MCVITNNNPLFLINNIVWYFYLLLLHFFQNIYLYSVVKPIETKRRRTRDPSKQKQKFAYMMGKDKKYVCRKAVRCILGITDSKIRGVCDRMKDSVAGVQEQGDQRGHGMSVIFYVNLIFLL